MIVNTMRGIIEINRDDIHKEQQSDHNVNEGDDIQQTIF